MVDFSAHKSYETLNRSKVNFGIELMAKTNYELFNIGTGKGISVLQCVQTFEDVTGIKVNYSFGNRRKGDIEKVWADNSKASEVLGWTPKYDLNEMLRSAWQWQLNIVKAI